MKSPFDDTFWKLEDLEPIDREYAEDMGCEEGKIYRGDFGDYLEIPQCPFCGCVVWEEKRCEHLVFIYDATNGDYEEVHETFKQRLIVDEELQAPESLVSHIKGLRLYEIYDVSGTMGTIWGFLMEKPLKRNNKKNRKGAKH